MSKDILHIFKFWIIINQYTAAVNFRIKYAKGTAKYNRNFMINTKKPLPCKNQHTFSHDCKVLHPHSYLLY